MNYSLWKSHPETGAVVATIGVRCEDHRSRPTVDRYLALVATSAIHGIDTSQADLLWKRDPIEIESGIVLLVNSQHFGTAEDGPVMGMHEIRYRHGNIKFH